MTAGRGRLCRLGQGVLAAGGLAVALSGCVTSGEGEIMKAETAKLRERIEAMERRDVDVNEQVARLRKILDEATALLTRNNADVGAKVNENEAELRALTGKLDELRDEIQRKGAASEGRLAALETSLTKLTDKVAPPMPEDKETLWREAGSRLQAGAREEGRRFYRAFVQKFPQDPRVPEAQLQLGRSFAAESKHTQAAAEYQRVIEAYAKSPQMPDAMFLLGQSYVELKFCSDAQALFKEVVRRYPRSPRAAEAKQRTRELDKALKDKRLCTS